MNWPWQRSKHVGFHDFVLLIIFSENLRLLEAESAHCVERFLTMDELLVDHQQPQTKKQQATLMANIRFICWGNSIRESRLNVVEKSLTCAQVCWWEQCMTGFVLNKHPRIHQKWHIQISTASQTCRKHYGNHCANDDDVISAVGDITHNEAIAF